MSDYVLDVVENVEKEDAVVDMNSWYNLSDQCDYVMPVAELHTPEYSIVKDVVEDPKNSYTDVNYAL